ncbi:MAG: CRISPR-associated protein Cas4 [Hydrogenobaculum sp.]
MLDLVDIIEKGLAIDEREKKIGIYYPSELSYCIRKNYYSYKSKPKYDLFTYKTFAIGNGLHYMIQNALISYSTLYDDLKVDIEESIKKTSETRLILDDLELHGRPDVFLVNTKTGERYIIEIKSHGNLEYLKEAEDKHLMQLNFYLNFFRDAKGILLYVNKAKPNKNKPIDKYEHFRVYQGITFNEELFKKLEERAKELHKSLKEDKLPIAEAKAKGEMWQCLNCPFKNVCKV